MIAPTATIHRTIRLMTLKRLLFAAVIACFLVVHYLALQWIAPVAPDHGRNTPAISQLAD
jgi:hypothetical protein